MFSHGGAGRGDAHGMSSPWFLFESFVRFTLIGVTSAGEGRLTYCVTMIIVTNRQLVNTNQREVEYEYKHVTKTVNSDEVEY